jgi:hypothetical protein
MARVKKKDDSPAPTVEKPVGMDKVMEYLNKGETYVYKCCDKGLLPYHQMEGARFFYLSEIEAAVKSL